MAELEVREKQGVSELAPWWMGARKRLYFAFSMPDHADQAPPGTPPAYQRLDPERIAANCARVGANAVVFYAKENQGNSYYPTSLGHHLSDLQGRDVVGEFVEGLRQHGLHAIAYFQPIRDRRLWEAEPSWRQINNDDSERVHNPRLQLGKGGHRLVCPLGRAGDAALAQLKELVTRYRLDGVWWDRVGDVYGSRDVYACLCDSCRDQFRAETGLEIPREAQWDSHAWRAFFAWRARALLRFQQRAHQVVRKDGQGACLISNYAFFGMAMADPTPLGADWEAIAQATDVASLEFQHLRSYLHMSSHPMLMRALTDKPVEILTWNAARIGDGYIRSPEATQVAILNSVARGHAITILDQLDHDGSVDPRLWELAERVFEQVDEVASLVQDTEPVHHAAILFSPDAFTWQGDGDPTAYTQNFMGELRQLLGEHVPCEIISPRHLSGDKLDQFRVLVLADSRCLSDAACEAITSWVGDGGVLLASHLTSTANEFGDERGDFGLGPSLGLAFEGVSAAVSCWMLPRAGAFATIAGDHPIAIHSQPALVRPLGRSVELLADLGLPMPGLDTFAGFVSPPGEWGPYPAVTANRFGKGAAIYTAGRPGLDELRTGGPQFRGVLRYALSLAEPAPVSIDAPGSVELIARQGSGGRLVVCLTNLQGEVGRTHRMPALPVRTLGIPEVLSLRDVAINVSGQVASARTIPANIDISIEPCEEGSRIVLPHLGGSATIVIDQLTQRTTQ